MGKPRTINPFTGERLRWLRDKNGISQQVVGDTVEVDQTAISQYERGQCMPSPETLQKLADYFDVSLDYLLGRTKERKNLNI